MSSAYSSISQSKTILPDPIRSVYEDLERGKLEWINRTRTEAPILFGNQSAWDTPISKTKLNDLLNNAGGKEDQARLKAVSSEHASDWLNAIPIPSLGLKLSNIQVKIACALRLGSNMCHPHSCICGNDVGKLGTHGLSCKKSSGRFARHAQVNDLIKRALTSANYPSMLEPEGISRTDSKRPDGLSLFPWKKGKCLVWDYTCRILKLQVISKHRQKKLEK